MIALKLSEAEALCERLDAKAVVVIQFADDHFTLTSHGQTKKLCRAMRAFVEDLADQIERKGVCQ